MPSGAEPAPERQPRRGRLALNRAAVEMPAFMPVGTCGSVKGALPSALEAMGAQVVLGNTFHLWLRPGIEIIRAFGGLHGCERWRRPVLTDSGGFQVWSLGAMHRMSEEGVRPTGLGQSPQSDRVSIHARPVKGARPTVSVDTTLTIEFQSTRAR